MNKLSQFIYKLTLTHWTATKRLLMYLKQTIFQGIHIKNKFDFHLNTYSDSDWVENINERTLTSTIISFLRSNPISLSLNKQRVVARSSTKVEYRWLANVVLYTVWLLSLFIELRLPVQNSSKLLCNNLNATYLSFNPIQHSQIKHIQIDLYFVCDMMQRRILNVQNVNIKD